MRRMNLLLSCVFVFGAAGCANRNEMNFQTQGRTLTLHTQPEGARVIQIAAPQGARVDLGMTPLLNQTVMVLTSFKGQFSDISQPARLAAELNSARVHIEKDGYKPWDGLVSTDPQQLTERTIVLEPLVVNDPPTTAQSALP